MIANFSQSLEQGGVDYLLISGQAAVLCGAATFSEDIDLWVNPTADTCRRFLAVLRVCRAAFYKLTPPFEPEWFHRGHGFHFLLPAVSEEPEVFLDVTGAPPRVGSFAQAHAGARRMKSDWGPLTVIGLTDLVELKKPQRLEDYPVISNLALAAPAQPGWRGTPKDMAWVLANLLTLSALRQMALAHPESLRVLPTRSAQTKSPLAFTLAMNTSLPPALVRVWDPKDATPVQVPVTYASPSGDTATFHATSEPVPPPFRARRRLPAESSLAMNMPSLPLLRSDTLPKVAVPW